MCDYVLIVGKNGYSASTTTSELMEALTKYGPTHTISCVAVGPSNYFAVICNSNVKKNSTYIGPEHFMETMQTVNKRDIKQISFGRANQYAITLKNGTCHAHLTPNLGVLEAINEHSGNIKYVSLSGVDNVWIVGYGKNEYCSGSLVPPGLKGFLDGIQLANKSIKYVEIGDECHYFVDYSNGYRFQLPQALSEFYQNTTRSFSNLSLYSEHSQTSVNSAMQTQIATLQTQVNVCKAKTNVFQSQCVQMKEKNEKLQNEIKMLKGLDVKVMNLHDLYQLKQIVTTTVSRLEREIEKKHKNNVLCITCLDKNQEVFFEPCHHLLMCQECSNKLTNNKCPVCKTEIRNKIKIFRP